MRIYAYEIKGTLAIKTVTLTLTMTNYQLHAKTVTATVVFMAGIN